MLLPYPFFAQDDTIPVPLRMHCVLMTAQLHIGAAFTINMKWCVMTQV